MITRTTKSLIVARVIVVFPGGSHYNDLDISNAYNSHTLLTPLQDLLKPKSSETNISLMVAQYDKRPLILPDSTKESSTDISSRHLKVYDNYTFSSYI